MPLCNFTPTDDGAHRCAECDTVVRAKPPIYRECARIKPPRAPRRPHRPRGPGTELRSILGELKIKEQEGCGCGEREARMNALGADGCRARRHALAGELRDAAERYRWEDRLTAGAVALLKGRWSLLSRNPYLAIIESAIAQAAERAKPREIKTRHLLYHLWPVAATDMWRWNVEHLLARIDQFNGCRVVAVALDDLTVPMSDVQSAFRGHDVKFLKRKNDPRLREAATFVELLKHVETSDPTHATFYAHAKGASRRGRPLLEVIERWTETLYRENLDDRDRVAQSLATHAMLGVTFTCEPVWQYPGTFWWLHNATLFGTTNGAWKKIENPATSEGPGWAVEAFPERMFARDECRSITIDLDAPAGMHRSLYAPEVWGLGNSDTLDEALARFDETAYLEMYADVAAGVAEGDWPSGREHFMRRGYDERRPI